jgi:hypothetical protein
MDSRTEDRGADGSSPEELELAIARAQVAWLIEILVLIGPRTVQVGYEFMRLRAYVEEGLKKIDGIERFKRITDDDIPF